MPGNGSGDATARPGWIMGMLFGAMLGSACIGLLFITHLRIYFPLTSQDFLTSVLAALGVMLACVSVILTIGAICAAIAGVVGYREFKSGTQKAATDKAEEIAVPVAIAKVDEYLKDLEPQIRERVIAIVNQTLQRDGSFKLDRMVEDDGLVATATVLPINKETGMTIDAAEAERERQETAMNALDAAESAAALRGDDDDHQDDDV